jgi:hypothetical protein
VDTGDFRPNEFGEMNFTRDFPLKENANQLLP